jgi:uncharacterized protein (TIGR00251 family)
VVVALRVTPRATRDAIEDVDGNGALRVRVMASPVDDAANKAVVKLLARSMGLPRSAVTLVSGATSRHKRVRLEGVDAPAVLERWPGVSLGGG